MTARGSAARSVRAALGACLLAIPAARSLGAQSADAFSRASDLEGKGDLRGAATAYRAALRGPNAEAALLGLERVCVDAGCADSVLAVVDSAIRVRPGFTLAHTVQLRTLRFAGRAADARAAFERWAASDPRNVLPYREYARLLIQGGGFAEADTVLRRGRSLGGGRALALEVAQQRAAAGLWVPSAQSWHDALAEQGYMAQAATYALRLTPAAERPAVLAALLSPPAPNAARGAAAALSLGWGAPAEAWAALASLPAGDSAAATWREFGERAEESGAWSAARDAFAAAGRATRNAADEARAASAALSAGDAAGALALAREARALAGAGEADRLVAAIEVRALARLGRAEEAEQLATRAAAGLPPDAQGALARESALAWVRRGDVTRARAALTRAGGDDDVGGLLALYDGDLAGARALLRHPTDPTPDVVLALAVLGRTTAPRGPNTGRAFLRLAQGDSAGAAAALEAATTEVGDAAPALVLAAARIHAARGDATAASAAWQRILRDYATSAEAPEADLAWGNSLARSGDVARAAERFEHLLMTYPESALAPQARAARLKLPASGAPATAGATVAPPTSTPAGGAA